MWYYVWHETVYCFSYVLWYLFFLSSQEREILTNAKKEARVVDPDSGLFYELDFYIPSLSLAFEYQVW